MKLKHIVVGAGIAALTATGLAPAALAAPGSSVTPEQCRDSGGSVQRADDGVGTCVGGPGSHDGMLIDDSAATSIDDRGAEDEGTSLAGERRLGDRDGTDRTGTDRSESTDHAERTDREVADDSADEDDVDQDSLDQDSAVGSPARR